MFIQDRIWGTSEIEEEVLEELCAHPALERLDKISQFGLPYRYYPLPQYTRYEHSIGTMLLLRCLGASFEEQIAGLLHDVSHTPFSHLIDLVMGDSKQENFQDNRHEEYLKNSSLYSLLQKHGFDAEHISSCHHFTLLELPPPHLCADRVDYAMREFKDWANPNIVTGCRNALMNYKGNIIFNTQQPARDFAYSYMKLQHEHWGGAEWMLRWQLFSEVLKYARDTRLINVYDIKKTMRHRGLKAAVCRGQRRSFFGC